MKRDKNGRFKKERGKYIDSKGYWCFSAGIHRGKRVHRVLMEKWIGRALRKDEVIHHADGNKLNNSRKNLVLMSEKEHNAVSAKQRWFLKTHDISAKKEWDAWFESEYQVEEVPFAGQF